MLSEITIENVAVIEKATAVFSEGFTVLTGETGAGKSILIDSINAILGSRTSREIVRSGAAKAKIWARFEDIDTKLRKELDEGGYGDEPELLVYREISAEGKSSCRVNGAPATVAYIRDICTRLVQIHGQHDNQSLMDPATHIGILDVYAENQVILQEYYIKYHELRKIEKELRELNGSEDEKERLQDRLSFAVDEIEKAELQPEEETALGEKRNIIRNAQEITGALNSAYITLAGGDTEEGAGVMLAAAAREITQAAGYDEELGAWAASLEEMYYTVTEMASEIGARLQDYEFDPMALDRLEQRLDLIYRLKNKYGGSVAQVLDYCENAKRELEGMAFSEQRISALQSEEKACRAAADALASKLTARREAAFKKLDAQLSEALAQLNMPGIQMRLQRTETPLQENGRDELEFLISTNPGEAPKPLAKIASGGELARIMLALKSALAEKDDLPTVIYDEIDTGISGLAAGRIGQMLQATAKGRQVICVTHTAQIAAHADCHLLIEKQVQDGRTFTGIQTLDEEGAVQELARIISGDHVTKTALANAREMRQMAKKST